MLKILKNFSRRILGSLFRSRKSLKIGFYGPSNSGKTSIANRICKDWTGEEIGTVSSVPHETRHVQMKEEVKIKYKGKTLSFKIIDTPGIATKIDYEDFLKHGLNKGNAKKRAKEATQGIIESIQWLDDMDAVIVVLDASENPYSQVNITILGNIDLNNFSKLDKTE